MKLRKLSLPFLAFLQSTALLVYVSFVASIMLNGDKIFGKKMSIFGPVMFLLLFVFSAVFSSLLFLGRAGYLFWEKRYKESFTLICWNLLWSFFYLTVLFVVLVSMR